MTAALIGASTAGRAAEWSYTPILTLGSDYDTNPYLSPTLHGDTAAISGSFLTKLARNTDTLSIALSPQVDYEWYSDRQYGHASDVSLAGSASWTGERGSLVANGQWADQSLVSAERFDTGVFDANTRRLMGEAAATWTDVVTERQRLAVTGSYQSIAYSSDVPTTLASSKYSSVGVTDGFIHSARLEIDVGATVGYFTSQIQTGATYSYAANVGFQWSGTERLTLSGYVGANRLDYGSTVAQSAIGNLKLAYSTPVGSLSLSAERGASPSGYGVLTERDVVQFQWSRSLAERWTFVYNIDLYRITDSLGLLSIDDRTFADTSATLSWRATEHWTVSGRALFGGSRLNEFRGPGASAREWQEGVFATWSPNPHAISR